MPLLLATKWLRPLRAQEGRASLRCGRTKTLLRLLPWSPRLRMDSTGVQVTLWQLSREKSLIAKRSELKGNSGHTSKANFGSDI